MTPGSPTRGGVRPEELEDPFTTPIAAEPTSSTVAATAGTYASSRADTLELAAKPSESSDDEEDQDGSEGGEEYDDEENPEESEEDEDDEPRLKYGRLTQHVGGVYRNGDATSSFIVSGDKMIMGTHNGNINVMQLPNFQMIRAYHAHSASVTAVSIWPCPPPLPKPGPNNPSNNIYIATSSMDGNICVQSLADPKDVQLRNFARPVQAVALSPDYKNDFSYLSGGRAGQLVLTAGAPQGKSTSTTVGTAAAATAGWLGSMGIGHNTGKDTVLHSGEGTIGTIKWSQSGKYVVWLNETGIKIMRSKIQLDSADADDAWKRIGHIDRPQTDEWEEMAGVWKGRVEWINEVAVESDNSKHVTAIPASPAAAKLQEAVERSKKSIERLLVGWGGTLWIIHVHPGGVGVGKEAGERSAGRAEIVKILRMDCIISGISLYTPNLLLVLAYCLPEKEDEEDEVNSKGKGRKARSPTALSSNEPSSGIRRRQNNLPPELRLIDLISQAEVDKDAVTFSRFERLSSGDYHLGTLFVPDKTIEAGPSSAFGSFAGFGSDIFNAALYPKALFSSGTSVKSSNSRDNMSARHTSTVGSANAVLQQQKAAHPGLAKPGLKIFIHSPYDCILATKRDLGDHLVWLIEHHEYQRAWELVEEHPEIISSLDKLHKIIPPTPDTTTPHATDDFFDDTSSVLDTASKLAASALEREKRRIGELWIQQLIEAGDWVSAGRVCGKVLGASDRWEKWVWTFATAKRYDEITPYIPTDTIKPLPRTIYEIVLGHYIKIDKARFRELLMQWSFDLYDINTVITALENQLRFRDVREDSVEDGEKGRDWKIVVEGLAKLYEANGRHREALRSYIKLQDADNVFRLIKEQHLAEAVVDDIPSFISLRVSDEALIDMSREDLKEATSEAISLLVDEAQHGLVKPKVVIEQLEKQDLNTFLFFYLRALWVGASTTIHSKGETTDRLIGEGRFFVEDYGDLAVQLFAEYDRPLLMEFLKASTSYTFEKAAQECESQSYIPELVYLYSKTGQMKRALFLIIDRLRDVSQAISFAKEQNDPDLWDDLLNYSMDKPRFIRGLLEEVGTAINPIKLVRRIPEGLEIEGLREGIRGIIREHEIQWSILEGTARVLRSEVGGLQRGLRGGQKKGIKFEVLVQGPEHVDVEALDVQSEVGREQGLDQANGDEREAEEEENFFWKPPKGFKKKKNKANRQVEGNDGETDDEVEAEQQPEHSHKTPRPGHCASCHLTFKLVEAGTLVGFACGHVFHLQHLLQDLHPDEDIEGEIGDMGEEAAELGAISLPLSYAAKTLSSVTGEYSAMLLKFFYLRELSPFRAQGLLGNSSGIR
ncbi:putative vacuolar assembly protein [Zalerion maritima]|uniref:Vacuolar assembly protein n=1 Tax=Zalerion maritima TaxID=339359 RepID=A0AAD5RSE8_9PEZI|nr:putative vacuolar assembly protein [Zalerion maritima]